MHTRLARLIVLLVPAFSAVAAVAASRPRAASLPFAVGERLNYNAKVTGLNVGKATISLDNMETVRGVPTFHAVFDIHGRVLFKHFDNHYESWFDTNLVSLKHSQKTPDIDKQYEFH